MKLLTSFIIALLFISPTATQAFGQGKQQNSSTLKTKAKKDELIARLETFIPQLMKDGDVPGLSIALVRDSQVLWQRGFGVKNAETKEAVVDNTIFEAASLSKPVFAYGVLKLVESNRLDLDAPLSKYLAQPYIENDERLNLITARRVLSHTTGFPNWRTGRTTSKNSFHPRRKVQLFGRGLRLPAKGRRAVNKPAARSIPENGGLRASWHDEQQFCMAGPLRRNESDRA